MSRKKDEENKILIVPQEIITREEFTARCNAYEEYYKKVPETRAFKRFQEMKEAWKKNNNIDGSS